MINTINLHCKVCGRKYEVNKKIAHIALPTCGDCGKKAHMLSGMDLRNLYIEDREFLTAYYIAVGVPYSKMSYEMLYGNEV